MRRYFYFYFKAKEEIPSEGRRLRHMSIPQQYCPGKGGVLSPSQLLFLS
jgi:hypothetical protein